MEDQRRNGLVGDSLSKRDKKRQLIGTRLTRLSSMFKNDRDNFYRNSLHELQTKLSTLQQGFNEEFLGRKLKLEEVRDYELTKLRLWEEYQVKRIETEYKEDLSKAKENHDKMIKLIKEKLYDKLQNQIKQLKEDKLLLNLVNGNSWSQAPSNENSANDSNTAALNAVASSLSLTDRRSLRKREASSRFSTGEADDLSDGGFSNNNASSLPHSNGYTSATGKRRRLYSTRYSSNDEMSSGLTSSVNQNGGGGSGMGYSGGGSTTTGNQNNGGSSNAGHNLLKVPHGHGTSGVSSGNDSNLSDKDYDALNSLIMENDDGGASLILLDKSNSNKPQTRGSHKQFVGVQGLKPEELNEDLNLLRNATVKKD
ncbi:Sds3-like protein [Scheffersomyces amazonensis]|uniref:Sds3-like protein n=1 Tax=Scheffersomyces amazonensis TaxID=1078765 RepID=UPI00315D7811